MDHMNRGEVVVDLRDVKARGLTDHIELKFYNQRSGSLNRSVPVEFKGRPRRLTDIPAFPFGLYELFISPKKYRFKSIFVNVPVGKPAQVTETCFVDPSQVSPSFPTFAEIRQKGHWAELWRIFQASGISTSTSWNKLSDHQKAGLLNIYAKTRRDVIEENGRPVVRLVERITRFEPDRIFAIAHPSLFSLVLSYSPGFHPVSGALHKFPAGWKQLSPTGSFKTYDKAGNLQLTFAQNQSGQLMADIDIDDHQGIEHAADVLRHKITGKGTHPYDIHQILIYFQGLDPGYELA